MLDLGKGNNELKEKVNEVKDLSEKDFNPQSYSIPKVNNNHWKYERGKIKKSEINEDFEKCTKGDYKCKKEAILNKHMLTKHQDHACKNFKEIFYYFMELLKHVANKHFQDPNEIEGI